MKFKTLSVIFFIFIQSFLYAIPYSKGEKITYKIRVWGIHVGFQTMTFHGTTTLNGKKVYYATAETRSLKSIKDKFNYELHDIMHVWTDPQTLLPVKVYKDIHEGNWKNKVTINIDQDNKTAVYYDKRHKNGKIHKLQNPTLDILSLIYYIRAHKQTTGKIVTFDYLVDKKGVNKVRLKISRGKPMNLGSQTVQTLQFNQIGGHGVKVRLTDDQYRLPLNISVATFEVHGYSINIVGHLVKYRKGQ